MTHQDPELASAGLFTSVHTVDIWREVIGFSIDPPEAFTDRQVVEQADWGNIPHNIDTEHVRSALGTLAAKDMLTINNIGSKNYRTLEYTRLKSLGWRGVEGWVEAFDDWYPLQRGDKFFTTNVSDAVQ